MLLVLALALQTAAASPSVMGFSCYGYGEKKPSKWPNISLESNEWQDDKDGGWYKFDRVAPAKVWLMDRTSNGVQRVYTLDRRSLLLDDTMFIGPGSQMINTQWICKIGPPIDINAGRKF